MIDKFKLTRQSALAPSTQIHTASEASEEDWENDRLNAVTLGGAYTSHVLRDRDSAATGVQ